MKRFFSLLVTIGATIMLLPSCQKDNSIRPASQSALSDAADQDLAVAKGLAAAQNFAASNKDNYGPGAVYQVELSANASGPQGGGLWLWIGLYPNQEGDYAGSDCGHGEGATSDKGDVSWQYTGANNDSVEINGVTLNGLGGFPTTITVLARYGHYSGTIGTFLTLPAFLPPFVGKSQLQVAR